MYNGFKKDKTCWKKLNEQIIYYETDKNVRQKQSHLILRNISANKIMDYLNIVPQNLGLLNTHKFFLYVLIETQKLTIIAKLYKYSLKMKVAYRICKQRLFYQGPTYNFSNNIIHISQDRRVIQLNRNKLIRSYKGKINEHINYDIIQGIELMSFNLFRKSNQFLLDKVQKKFESIFNISLLEINDQFGPHVFKKIGNFIILKKKFKHWNYIYKQKSKNPLVYYLSLEVLLKGNGTQGQIYLDKEETLKIIQQFNISLYAVTSSEKQLQVYEIKNQSQMLIQQIDKGNKLKKPILQLQHLIFTNKGDFLEPEIIKIDIKNYKQKRNEYYFKYF